MVFENIRTQSNNRTVTESKNQKFYKTCTIINENCARRNILY